MKNRKLLKVLFVGILIFLLIIFLKENNFLFIKDFQSSKIKVNDELNIDELTSSNLWKEINQWRLSSNLDEYIWDEDLCSYARIRLLDVDSNLSHQGFFEIEEQIFAETKFTRAAENLASGVKEDNLDQVLTSWLDSPKHKQNLEDSYTHSCLSCQNNICVQLFAEF